MGQALAEGDAGRGGARRRRLETQVAAGVVVVVVVVERRRRRVPPAGGRHAQRLLPRRRRRPRPAAGRAALRPRRRQLGLRLRLVPRAVGFGVGVGATADRHVLLLRPGAALVELGRPLEHALDCAVVALVDKAVTSVTLYG